MLLANNRKRTAAHVEKIWLDHGCKYVGSFVLSTALRYQVTSQLTYNCYGALALLNLPENIKFLHALGVRIVPKKRDIGPMLLGAPHPAIQESFYRDLHHCLQRQLQALEGSTLQHYYAYTKVYKRYCAQYNEYGAYILIHIQCAINNQRGGRDCNVYSELQISEHGDNPRLVYQRVLSRAKISEEDIYTVDRTGMELEMRVPSRRSLKTP